MRRRSAASDQGITYELVATLDVSAIAALEARGVTLEPDTVFDAPGPTAFAYVTSGGDEFLLIHQQHPLIPAVDVLAPKCDADALERLVDSLGGGSSLVTWRSDAIA